MRCETGSPNFLDSGNLVPRVFVPYCACWLDETFPTAGKRNEDAGYEGGTLEIDYSRAPCLDADQKGSGNEIQFRYIKIQLKIIGLSTRLCGINPTNSVFIPQSLVLMSIVLC